MTFSKLNRNMQVRLSMGKILLFNSPVSNGTFEVELRESDCFRGLLIIRITPLKLP